MTIMRNDDSSFVTKVCERVKEREREREREKELRGDRR